MGMFSKFFVERRTAQDRDRRERRIGRRIMDIDHSIECFGRRYYDRLPFEARPRTQTRRVGRREIDLRPFAPIDRRISGSRRFIDSIR